MTENRILNIGFIGFGLIGGSIAKAIKKKHPEYIITVASRSQAPLFAAVNDGIVDNVRTQPDDSFSDCDYIFLCTPVVTITKYLAQLKVLAKPGCIITDAGSVKGYIHRAVSELEMDDMFIGGHPMTGSELSGYANSNAELLKDAKYVITPTEKTSKEQLSAYASIVEDMGAVPVVMDYRLHDYTVAGISHVPHLIAAALTRTVQKYDDSEGHMHLLAAGGFRDTTRIAASSPEMWTQICDANRDAICDILDKYISEMQDIKKHIAAGKNNADDMREFIEKLFTDAGSYRNSF